MKWTMSSLVLLSAASLYANQGTININLTHPGPMINPNMYGIFLEEINHGVDGGLYAELVRNRAFEDSRPIRANNKSGPELEMALKWQPES